MYRARVIIEILFSNWSCVLIRFSRVWFGLSTKMLKLFTPNSKIPIHNIREPSVEPTSPRILWRDKKIIRPSELANEPSPPPTPLAPPPNFLHFVRESEVIVGQRNRQPQTQFCRSPLPWSYYIDVYTYSPRSLYPLYAQIIAEQKRKTMVFLHRI